jgi:hypothetical protein
MVNMETTNNTGKKIRKKIRKLVYIDIYASGVMSTGVGIAYYFHSTLVAIGFSLTTILVGLQGLYLAGDEVVD